jgi:hypothetical protein
MGWGFLSRNTMPPPRHGEGAAFLQKLLQHQSTIMTRIAAAAEQGHVSLSGCRHDGAPGIGMAPQLRTIPPPEFFPFGHIMPVPSAQTGARRHIFQPGLHLKLFFLQPARPQSLDQKSHSIAGLGRFINTFDLEHAIFLQTAIILASGASELDSLLPDLRPSNLKRTRHNKSAGNGHPSNFFERRGSLCQQGSYRVALMDWFGAPRVLEIDSDNWTGASARRSGSRHRLTSEWRRYGS